METIKREEWENCIRERIISKLEGQLGTLDMPYNLIPTTTLLKIANAVVGTTIAEYWEYLNH